MNFKNKSDAVRAKAEGRWLEILAVIAPALKDAVKECPNHVPCPINSGNTDGFRLFKDANMTGGGISNSSGARLMALMFSCGFLTMILKTS